MRGRARQKRKTKLPRAHVSPKTRGIEDNRAKKWTIAIRKSDVECNILMALHIFGPIVSNSFHPITTKSPPLYVAFQLGNHTQKVKKNETVYWEGNSDKIILHTWAWAASKFSSPLLAIFLPFKYYLITICQSGGFENETYTFFFFLSFFLHFSLFPIFWREWKSIKSSRYEYKIFVNIKIISRTGTIL